MENQADKRALRTIRKLNAIRHKQEQQIDILCNDMVSANKDVIEKLKTLTYTVDFYESIIGEMDMNALLDKTARQIRNFVRNSNVAIFLTNTKGFELHMADDNPIEFDGLRIESYFTDEVVNGITRSTRICSLDDMCNLGLQGNPNVLNHISAAAVPVGRFGEPVGFILICRGNDNKLTSEELEKVTTITPGLRRAFKACEITRSEVFETDSDMNYPF